MHFISLLQEILDLFSELDLFNDDRIFQLHCFFKLKIKFNEAELNIKVPVCLNLDKKLFLTQSF